MKQEIIEIVGPPGVGKSTVYRSLCKTWTPSSNWIYQDALLLPDKPSFLDFISWLEYHSKRLLGRKLAKSINSEFGLRFVDKNPDLANFYWNNLSDTRVYSNQEINKRFRSAYFLFYDFCRYQAILEKSHDRPCLINEGLLQKSFFIHEDESVTQNLLNTYLSLLPLPYAIIFINSPDNNVILKRLRGRKKVIASHLGKDDEELLTDIEKWQRMLHLVVEKAEEAGVKVLRVNGEQQISTNVHQIKEMLESL